ncbi:MAG TPA: hypothetical protein VKS03_01510 [Thermoanaerobaculia bacterium]|nr:hypothetical protein [Thermoanaerobaculia bacterium]
MTFARESAARLAELLSRERSAMAEFLVALADFDRRRLWEPLGHAGLFPFLHRELGMSKAAVQSTGRRNTESDTGGAHEPESSMDERIGAQ